MRPVFSFHSGGGKIQRLLAAGIFCLASLFFGGCAVRYYDARTGTEHLWGFGHMKMKVTPPNEGVRAVVKGTETLGAGVRLGSDDYSLVVGWERNRRIVVEDDTMVRLEWPDADFFTVRVGSNPPPEITSEPKPQLQ